MYKSSNTPKKGIIIALALMLFNFALSSCQNDDEIVLAEGIRRETKKSETEEVSTIETSDTSETFETTETSSAADETVETEVSHETAEPNNDKMWSIVDGKYVFDFPARSNDKLDTVDEMYDMPKTRFDDQPNDWFFGKTERNPETGDVTYLWDRSASTLDTLKKYNAIYRGDTESKVCYLTFDCGYENGTMDSILDTLNEKKVSATFFVNGHYVRSASDKIQRMIDEGHIIGNHALNHYNLTEVSVDTFLEEVQGLEELYYETLPDAPPMLYFRPPSGNCNEWVIKFADKLGYRTVLWSWAYKDFDENDQLDVDEALQKVMKGLHNGSVILLHPESQTNTEMLGQMIDEIRDAGYEILPLCDIE